MLGKKIQGDVSMQKLARLGTAFVVAATLANFSGTMPAKADANAPFCLNPA